MSLVASFHLLNRFKLPELLENADIIVKKSFLSKKAIDNYWDFLASNSLPLESFKYLAFNDGVYVNVLSFLSEKHNIDLTTSEYENEAEELSTKRGSSVFILTNGQKLKYFSLLNPENFSVDEIQQFNTEFEEDDDRETALACKEAIAALYNNFKEIKDDSSVIIFTLG